MSLAADNTPRPGRPRAPRPDPAAIRRFRAELDRTGKTVTDWAHEHGEDAAVVHNLLSGTRAMTTGDVHRVAVKMGLKNGVIPSGPRNIGESDRQPDALRSDNRRAPVDMEPRR